MDFSTDPEFDKTLTGIREFVEAEVFPLEAEMAKNQSFKKTLPSLEKARTKARANGFWLPQMPKDVGGMGLSLMQHALVSEVCGRSPLGHYVLNCQAPDAGNMEILHTYGSDAQKTKWLKPLLAGEHRSCFSMTEPDVPGSNPTWLETTAKREGDEYVIRGRKWFTTAADGAAFAIVMAVTDPSAASHNRASQIIVPTDNPGFRILRNISVMGHAGDDYDSHSEVEYVDCRVPVDNLLGPEHGGFMIAQERLGPGRIHHCMRWMGICERSFELMAKRAATRQIAPGKPLGHKQLIQGFLAESRAEIQAARLMVLHAAWVIETKGLYEAREEISLIKFFCANVLQKVVDRAIQVHGALGMTDDTPLAHFYRHERAARIYDGADEVHKVVVAKRILRKYGVSAG